MGVLTQATKDVVISFAISLEFVETSVGATYSANV